MADTDDDMGGRGGVNATHDESPRRGGLMRCLCCECCTLWCWGRVCLWSACLSATSAASLFVLIVYLYITRRAEMVAGDDGGTCGAFQ